jgi:hypothetical protein
MEPQRLSAVLLIAGFAILLLGFVFGIGINIYQTTDISERVRIIEENKTRWNISSALSGLGLLIIPIGFAVLTS